MMGKEEDNILHVFGQSGPHDEVAIVGDYKALDNWGKQL